MSKVERVYQPLKKLLWHNFLGGIAWSIGVTIGATVLLGVIGFVLSNIDWVPFVGSFVSNIVEFVVENNPRIDGSTSLINPES